VCHLQSHFLSANALRVGLPFSSFMAPLTPDIRAQKDDLRAAAFGDFLACSALTGGLRLPPVARLYLALPAAVRPPEGFLSFLVITTDGFFFIMHLIGHESP